MTASHSSSVAFTSIRSRRKPALLTSTSSPPNVSTACATICRAPSKSATSLLLDTASPPSSLISVTTSSAGPEEAPSPAPEVPRSFTTTFAPCRASSSACSRPRPRPAPVTIAMRPSQILVMGSSRFRQAQPPVVAGFDKLNHPGGSPPPWTAIVEPET